MAYRTPNDLAAERRPKETPTDAHFVILNTAEAAKSVEAADELRGQIAELKQQSANERIEYKLKLAGVRNVKTAKAEGSTGLPNAGAASDAGKTLKRWRDLAWLEDEE